MDVTKPNRDINSLQPIAQQAAKLFLETCKARGINIFVTEYHRSQARQDYLYAQGRTREGKIVTWTRNSNHTSGYAWDIACNKPHDLYDSKVISKAGEVAKELGIEWGGTWKQQDTPHFQADKNWKAPVGNTIKIKLNGVVKEVEAINKDGNNYIKLQDLRDSKIHIGYNCMPIIEVK